MHRSRMAAALLCSLLFANTHAPAQQPTTPDQVRGGVNARVAAGNVAQRQFEQVLQVVHG